MIIILLLTFAQVVGQERAPTPPIEMEPYFKAIKKLVDDKSFPRLESLLANWEHAQGKERVDACFELFVHYIFKSTEIAKKYNDEAFSLSMELGYDRGYLRASLNQAYIFFVQGEFDKATDIVDRVETNDKCQYFAKIEADAETLKSYIFTERGEYDLAYETALNLLEKGESLKNPYCMMRAYSAISHFYLRLGEYDKALENCLKGLDFILKLKEVRFIFPKIDEMARMTHKLEGSKKALAIYDFYLELEKSIQSPGSYIQSVVYMNIASIYIEESDFVNANDFLWRALNLIETNNYRFRKPRVHLLIADMYLKQGDSLKAKEDYYKAYNAAKEIDAFDVIKEVSKSLSSLNRAMGNKREAEFFSDLYLRVGDSLFSIESEQKLKILEAKRRISEISRQKEILEIKTESQEERYRFMTIIFVLTLALGIIATYSYFRVKKKNKLLYFRTKELAEEKLNQKKLVAMEKVKNPSGQIVKASSGKNYMDEDIKEIILTKLNRLEEEDFFLDPKCSLRSLSNTLQTNQKYLSQVINHEKKSNFNNYINELRINHLLNRLLEDKEYRNSKLTYIATTSGFNNLNTFYSAFKKRLGILPSYFIEKLNEEDESINWRPNGETDD
ncbi:MAG: helix-turn-helix domain-containing protein [Bacteroidota bacterium]|nr:helix-turn-helix domain-containing protein [Bacteroidota bacterium]